MAAPAIAPGRVAEIIDQLNGYPPRTRKPALLGIWSWTIKRLPELDEDKTCDLYPTVEARGDVDKFALSDGTVIRYDHTAGMWDLDPARAWRPDGTGVVDGGDVGGDIQAGDSYSVRFTRPDKPGSLITVNFYPVGYPEFAEPPDEWAVQTQTEYLVCTDPADPGGTEIWSDNEYRDVNVYAYTSLADAQADAERYARAELGNGGDYTWDGEPQWTRQT